MTEYRVPYGTRSLTLNLPDSLDVEVVAPAACPTLADPTAAVYQALDHPVGDATLAQWAHAKSVAIAINDKTRPVPLKILLPPLLRRLADLGIPRQAVTLIVATGTHPLMEPREFAAVVPAEILSGYRVVSHDCDDRDNLVLVGETSRGTPVWTSRLFVNAELRIAVGNLEPHQFVGFSGGVKSAAIGLAGRETVTRNHSLMLDPRSQIAVYDENPARQDIEEIGKIIGVRVALNSVVNEEKQIVAVFAGDPREVMRRGIPVVLDVYLRQVAAPFDLVISSPGGHPKDINLYQAQKALAHASFVTREGGTVILVAACPEGTGSKHYEDWITGKTSHAQVIDEFRREGYRIGAHKAYQISRDAARERVLFVTDMSADYVSRLLLTRTPSLQDAVTAALRDLPPGARVGVLPYANATIPRLVS